MNIQGKQVENARNARNAEMRDLSERETHEVGGGGLIRRLAAKLWGRLYQGKGDSDTTNGGGGVRG